MTKPKPLTRDEINQGKLSAWCENYAVWLSGLNSFQNQTNRKIRNVLELSKGSIRAQYAGELPKFSRGTKESHRSYAI